MDHTERAGLTERAHQCARTAASVAVSTVRAMEYMEGWHCCCAAMLLAGHCAAMQAHQAEVL
jgi:hypothetical protein